MKNFKLSMLVMLSAIAMTFTSCLGDGDNTQYVMGTGTVSSSSAVILDNGLTLKSSVWGNTAVDDRIYVYASVPGDEYETAIDNLQAGKSASVNLENIYQAGVCIEGDLEEPADFDQTLASETVSEMESLSWLSYGSFGNGYMNFSIKANWYTKTANNTTTNVMPYITLMVKDFDATAKKLELVVVYDNRKAECVDAEGKADETKGYKLVSGGELPVSVDVTDLYYEMKSVNLTDEDKIDLSIKYVENEARDISTDELTGTLGTSTNYCTVGMFKRTVY